MLFFENRLCLIITDDHSAPDDGGQRSNDLISFPKNKASTVELINISVSYLEINFLKKNHPAIRMILK